MCVREKAGYKASDHKQLAGVAFVDADEGVDGTDVLAADASVTTMLNAPAHAAYTVTAQAWTFGNFELMNFEGTNFELHIEEDEDLVSESNKLVYPDDDDDDYTVTATDVGGKPGVVQLVITPKGGGSDTNLDVKIEFTPPLGDAVTLTVNFPGP